jgi:adenosylhomocysteine nucleosidase
MDPPVFVVIGGVGKLATASAVSEAIGRFPEIEAVLSFGVSGSLSHDLMVGDLVVATEVVEHDFEVLVLGNADAPQHRERYRRSLAHQGLAQRLLGSCRAVKERIEDSSVPGPNARVPEIFEGGLCSGDQLVASASHRASLTETHPRSYAVDMETAAVAYVAQRNALPWGSVRMISDDATDVLDPESFVSFVSSQASRVLGEIFLHLLGQRPHGEWEGRRSGDTAAYPLL